MQELIDVAELVLLVKGEAIDLQILFLSVNKGMIGEFFFEIGECPDLIF